MRLARGRSPTMLGGYGASAGDERAREAHRRLPAITAGPARKDWGTGMAGEEQRGRWRATRPEQQVRGLLVLWVARQKLGGRQHTEAPVAARQVESIARLAAPSSSDAPRRRPVSRLRAASLVILLSSDWHERSTRAVFDRYRSRLPVTVWAHEAAAGKVACVLTDTVREGAPLPGGVRAYEISVPYPSEVVYYLPPHRALELGDAEVLCTGHGPVLRGNVASLLAQCVAAALG